MANDNLNPMTNVYLNFEEILQNMTIKYSFIAEENEREDAKQRGDEYLDSYLERDSFENYCDYLYEDYIAVGLTDTDIISEAMSGNNDVVPNEYRVPLLNIRRNRVLKNYTELNNYYRMLNGYPDLVVDPYDNTKLDKDDTDRYYIDPSHLFYVPEDLAKKYDVIELYNDRIPVHYIQDYYNSIEPNLGDRYMSILEGSGYIRDLYKANPEMTYLKYFGSHRIPLNVSREAKNFQLLQLHHGNIKFNLYHQFTQIYEQCRQYFMDVIFIREFRSFIDNYDRFIAMSIMVMTLQQTVMKQLQLTVNREFFDPYAVRMLYQAYGIPYNLNLDEETQARISQNLNMFIQAKATDRGLYNIAEVLGFTTNFSIYKYYLSKEHKLDQYGVPIIKYHEVFNNDTGEVETKPDYEAMYNVYFHREELKKQNFINSFNDSVNTSRYEEITDADPFWIKDSRLNEMVYETEYNFVESKYLGLSISYKLTDLMYENLMLMKTIIKKHDEVQDLKVTLPKITGEVQIPIFDIIICMICLTAAKHNLTGEILSLPTDILSYLDYMTNTDASEDYLVDTFSFNFDYFLEPDWEKSWWLNKKALKVVSDDTPDESFNPSKMVKISNVVSKIPDVQIGDYVIDKLTRLYQLMSEDEVNKIKSYINILTIPDTYTVEEKQAAFNELLTDIKGFQKFISFKMTETKDRRVYRRLRDLARTIFYAKEVRDVFNLHLGDTTRTAHNYFEYLYYKNPVLYNAIFEVDIEAQYHDFVSEKGQYERLLKSVQLQYLRYYHIYCEEHGLSEDEFTVDDYKETFTYWQFKAALDNQTLKYLTTSNYTIKDFRKDVEKNYVQLYTESDISYEDFVAAVDAGEFIDDNDIHHPVYIKYDYIAGSKVDNVDIKDEKVYFYLNHIISRLEVLIDNIKYLYMLSDATTPLEELLIKLIKFFKSYTTDMISFENIIILDLIPENMMKLYDKVHYINKTIQPRENIHHAYSDVIRTIINLYLNDRMKFRERYINWVRLLIDEKWGITNSVRLKDAILEYEKEILIKDKYLKHYDVVHDYSNTIIAVDKPKDKHLLRDKVLVYYDD